MEDSKNLLLSKTFWGAMAAIAVSVASMLHVNLGDASGWANDLVAVAGGLFAIYGRAKAVKKIG